MTEQEYLEQGQRISERIEQAEKEVAEAEDALDDLRGKQAVLQEEWKEKRRKFAELPYGAGDIVRFDKAGLPANRTREYRVTKTNVDKVWLEIEGNGFSISHDEAEKTGIIAVRDALS